MQEADAIELVVDAIESGIFNDLGSGSNVDVCVIREKTTQMLRNYRKPNERAHKEKDYKFPRGTTAWTKEQIYDMIVQESTSPQAYPDVIDLDTTQGSEGMEMDAS